MHTSELILQPVAKAKRGGVIKPLAFKYVGTFSPNLREIIKGIEKSDCSRGVLASSTAGCSLHSIRTR
ncbi:hypothetical protein CBM2587_B60291 [Cupriavidus taiwanensis]|uniref:Uncharacterized protein n=1 Tax=Cupriavidus taiwanensis TaxID=164546 RepID=A0A375C656_9BURK|nr:hypothetical protein CBM2587_B60291 [Cupriavidus taiwanensis]